MVRNFLISKKNRLMFFIICAFLFLNACSAATLAAGTGTGGSGSGSGTDMKPFNFVGTYLTTINGNSSSTGAEVTTTQVPLKPTIKIVFDKNVVKDAFWSNNEQCLNMFASSGVKVPAQVFRISDQVNFEERQNIFIAPLQDLNPGAAYKIIISPGLLAGSGSELGMTSNNQPVVIQFNTQAETTAKTAEENLSTNSNSSSTTSVGTPKEKLSTNSLVLYIVAGTFLVLCCFWISVRWFIRKR